MNETFFESFGESWKQALENELFVISLTVLIVFGVQFIVHHFIGKLVRRSVRQRKGETRSDEKKREDTLINVIRTVASVIVWLTAIIVILGELGLNISALLAGAGVFSVILGFGAQNTIRDYLAGMYILMENQYRVGDVVTLSGGTTGLGVSGVVEEISLRITKLRSLDGTMNTIRNGEATIITNQTFHYSAVVVDINVSYDSDIDTVEKMMNKVGLEVAGDEKWKSLTVEPIQFLRVDKFTDVAVVARAVGKVSPASQWEIAGEYRRKLLKALKAKHVKIGVPHVIVAPQDEHIKAK